MRAGGGGGGGGGDTTPPTVGITAPAGGSTVSGTVTVSANATDNAGVVGVQFKLDGANLGAEDTAAPYSVSWSTAGLSGTHTLAAVARDAAGNTTTSAPVTVTVGTGGGGGGGGGGAGMSVSITTPTNPAWTGNSLHVIATASSSGAALTGLTLYGNGAGALTKTCGGTSCALDDWWNTAPLANGAYQIQAVATDATGAQAVSSIVTVYKNATTPVHPSGAPRPAVAAAAVTRRRRRCRSRRRRVGRRCRAR